MARAQEECLAAIEEAATFYHQTASKQLKIKERIISEADKGAVAVLKNHFDHVTKQLVCMYSLFTGHFGLNLLHPVPIDTVLSCSTLFDDDLDHIEDLMVESESESDSEV